MDLKRTSRHKDRRRERWIREFKKQKAIYKKIRDHASDILASRNFQSTKSFIQHGNVTVNDHCLNVARQSLKISQALHIRCSEKELVRGALLHDYFLYDWHDKTVERQKLHGFHHPFTALRNASKEYDLTAREKDIIKKHMWPLTVIPPACREAWIVTVADKWVSTLETMHMRKGHGKKEILQETTDKDEYDASQSFVR